MPIAPRRVGFMPTHCWLLDKKDEVEEEYRPDSTEPHAYLPQGQQALTGDATNPEKIIQ
jgi:hypothetical protein